MSDLVNVSNVLDQFAGRIRAMRLQLNWSREELAQRAEINVYTLKHFERTGKISLERFLKLCDALNTLDEVSRLLKPRQRVDVDKWVVSPSSKRQRGRKQETVCSGD